jgi:DNA-binding NtrC family response regulator
MLLLFSWSLEMRGDHKEQHAPAVLIIEDDPGMRALLKDFLEREGLRVFEEANGEGAITLVESSEFDAVILDKEMPGVNGLDLLGLFRRRCPDTPVILITAFGGATVAEEARRRGAARYLEKPFRFTDLLEAVRTVTKRGTA